MTRLKLQRIGDGVGFILPPELMAHLNVKVGQELEVSLLPHGILLRRAGEEAGVQMPVAREVMDKRRQALRRLAD